MAINSIIGKLRGNKSWKLGEITTVYLQGSVICLLGLVALTFLLSSLLPSDMLIRGIVALVFMVVIYFGTRLAVDFSLHGNSSSNSDIEKKVE